MRILFAGDASSANTASWLSKFKNTGFEFYLFPSEGAVFGTHPEIKNYKNVTILEAVEKAKQTNNTSYFVSGEALELNAVRLASYIEKINPDIIHSADLHKGSVSVLNAKKRFKGKLPFWIVSICGADMFFFGRISRMQNHIAEILYNCDYVSCGCSRDILLSRFFGFLKKPINVFRNTPGFDAEMFLWADGPIKTSKRKLLIFHFSREITASNLCVLRALERCSDILNDFEICIYSEKAPPEYDNEIELFSKTGISLKAIPSNTSREEMLSYYKRARVSIDLDYTAASSSLPDLMSAGVFPVRSSNSCEVEWVKNGENGIFVNHSDTDSLENAIRRSVSDDVMVDKASEINLALVRETFENCTLKNNAVSFYDTAYKKSITPDHEEFLGQKICINDLPKEFNLIVRREILLKVFGYIYEKNDYISFSALSENLEKLIDSDSYIKERFSTMEYILGYKGNLKTRTENPKEALSRVENSTMEEKYLPLAYRIFAEAAIDADHKTYMICKLKRNAYIFETIPKITEIDETISFLNEKETKNFFEVLKSKSLCPDMLPAKIEIAYFNIIKDLSDSALEGKIQNIFNLIFNGTGGNCHLSASWRFCIQDFTQLYLKKKIDFLREFVLYSFFLQSRKPDAITFLNIKSLFSEILKVDDYLYNNCIFLQFFTESYVGKTQPENVFEMIKNLVKEKSVSREFVPLYYHYIAEKSLNDKDKYFAAKLMELAVKISVDSIPNREYDIMGKPDAFLDYISSRDSLKYLYEKQKKYLEKELSGASTDKEISEIQNRIQQLYRLLHDIK